MWRARSCMNRPTKRSKQMDQELRFNGDDEPVISLDKDGLYFETKTNSVTLRGLSRQTLEYLRDALCEECGLPEPEPEPEPENEGPSPIRSFFADEIESGYFSKP